MNRYLSLGIAVLCGMLIGGLVANGIGDSHLYLLMGALVGGFAAYCIMEPREFYAGAAVAWQRVAALNPDRAWWRQFRANVGLYWASVGAATLAALSVTTTVALVGFLALRWVRLSREEILLLAILIVVYMVGSVVAIFLVPVGMEVLPPHPSHRRQKYRQGRRRLLRIALYGNPVGLVYLALVNAWRVPRGFALLWGGLRTLAQFVGHTFALVHSNARTLAFVDTALGIVAVYYYGGSFTANIIGAAIGAVLAPFHYWLVSVRWLGLSARTQRA